MARKDALQLQLEINSDEEWNELISRSGLIVVDVYCEWSGPCTAMVNLLRKIKMEIGGDLLLLAIANCDKIEALKRFRGNCEPTWLFIAGGGLVNLMFGANAPQLRRLMVSELEIQTAVEEGTMRRYPIPWDKLTEEEQRREDIRLEIERKKQQEKEDAIRAAAARRLARIGWALHKCTILVYLPFTWDANENTLPAHDEIAKLLEDDLFVRETIKIDLDPITACELFYGGVPEKVPEEEVVEEEGGEEEEGAEEGAEAPPKPVPSKAPPKPAPSKVQPKPVPSKVPPPSKEKSKTKSVAVLGGQSQQAVEGEVERCPPPELVEALLEGKTIIHYAEALSPAVEEGQLPPPPEDIIKKTALAVYGCPAPPEGQPQQIDPESPAARYARSELVPAVWTPTTVLRKMDALERLFPLKMERFHKPPIPPHMAVAFEATRYRELAPALKDNQDAILQLAFFTSTHAATAQRVANNYREFVLTSGKTGNEKLVLQLDTTNKVPLLNLAALGPCYFSLSPEEGLQDCEYFFPPKEETFEEEEEAEEEEEGEKEEDEEDEEAFLAAEEAALRGEKPPTEEGAEEGEEEAKEGEAEGAEEDAAAVEGTEEGAAPAAPEDGGVPASGEPAEAPAAGVEQEAAPATAPEEPSPQAEGEQKAEGEAPPA